jgi:hypothetical protein
VISWLYWRVARPLIWHITGWRERRESDNIAVRTGKFPAEEDTMAKGRDESRDGGQAGTSPGSKGGQGGTGPGRPGTAGGSGGTKGDEGNKGDGVKN